MRLIDADALIRELNNNHFPGAPYVDAGISIAIGKVCDAPTIGPERKKGRWIFVNPLQEDDTGAYMCSKCRAGNWEIDPKRYFFCPYCGADMRGEQDEID